MDLRRWRRAEGLTAAEFGRRVGASGESISCYERGTRRPRPEIARRIEEETRGMVAASSLLGLGNSGGPAVRENAKPFDSGSDVPVKVPEHLLRLAEDYGLDVPALLAEGGIDAVAEAGRKAFYEANKDAIEANRRHVEKYGTFAERHGVFPNR